MTRIEDHGDALRIGYLATDWTDAVAYDDYVRAVADWRVRGVVRDDECIGAVYTKGDELHVSILPAWRGKWATKGLLAEMIGGRRTVTKVSTGHEWMFGILARLGFQPDGALLVRG